MIKRIKSFIQNLKKDKCPKCKSMNIEKIKEDFLHTIEKPYYTYDKYQVPSEKINHIPSSFNTYKVYEITYKCENCKFIFCKNIEK